jgi:hypothetical protein
MVILRYRGAVRHLASENSRAFQKELGSPNNHDQIFNLSNHSLTSIIKIAIFATMFHRTNILISAIPFADMIS